MVLKNVSKCDRQTFRHTHPNKKKTTTKKTNKTKKQKTNQKNKQTKNPASTDLRKAYLILWLRWANDLYHYIITSFFPLDVKWCPVSRITTPLASKRLFHSISMKSWLVGAARETNWSHLTNSHHRYMAEILHYIICSDTKLTRYVLQT